MRIIGWSKKNLTPPLRAEAISAEMSNMDIIMLSGTMQYQVAEDRLQVDELLVRAIVVGAERKMGAAPPSELERLTQNMLERHFGK